MTTQKTIVDTIDVRDLPETAIDVLLAMTDLFRAKNAERHYASSIPVSHRTLQNPLTHGILQKPGRALRPATRDVIYGDDV